MGDQYENVCTHYCKFLWIQVYAKWLKSKCVCLCVSFIHRQKEVRFLPAFFVYLKGVCCKKQGILNPTSRLCHETYIFRPCNQNTGIGSVWIVLSFFAGKFINSSKV
jgi:hypothetical protein